MSLAHSPSILIADDDASILTMLRMVLEGEGYAVTTVATVPQALEQISKHPFDVLISDLNLGHPADGFVVVSAMRRTHSAALTFILTGYPAFEAALEAMRQDVNDYLVKGTPVEKLLEKIKAGLAHGKQIVAKQTTKRVPLVIEENKDWVISEWMTRIKNSEELMRVVLSDDERRDHVPGLLEEAISHAREESIGPDREQAAYDHGTLRYQQGYSVAMLALEARLLQHVICEGIRRNFLVIDIGSLVTDMTKMWDTIALELEYSIRAYMSQFRSDS